MAIKCARPLPVGECRYEEKDCPYRCEASYKETFFPPSYRETCPFSVREKKLEWDIKRHHSPEPRDEQHHLDRNLQAGTCPRQNRQRGKHRQQGPKGKRWKNGDPCDDPQNVSAQFCIGDSHSLVPRFDAYRAYGVTVTPTSNGEAAYCPQLVWRQPLPRVRQFANWSITSLRRKNGSVHGGL